MVFHCWLCVLADIECAHISADRATSQRCENFALATVIRFRVEIYFALSYFCICWVSFSLARRNGQEDAGYADYFGLINANFCITIQTHVLSLNLIFVRFSYVCVYIYIFVNKIYRTSERER